MNYFKLGSDFPVNMSFKAVSIFDLISFFAKMLFKRLFNILVQLSVTV